MKETIIDFILLHKWEYSVAFILSSIAFFIVIQLYPLQYGRDLIDYIRYGEYLFRDGDTYPVLMIYRPPVSSIYCYSIDRLYSISPLLGYIPVFIAWTICHISIFSLSVNINQWLGYVILLILFLSVDYLGIFTYICAESLAVAVIPLFALFLQKSLNLKGWLHFSIVNGIICIFLILIRPNFQVFYLIGVYPFIQFLFKKLSIRSSIKKFFGFIVMTQLLMNAYFLMNFIKFDHYGFWGGELHIPFYRAYHSGSIDASNGNKSDELKTLTGKLIEEHKDLKELGITAEDLLAYPDYGGFHVVVYAAINYLGKIEGSDLLRKCSFESIIKDPLIFWGSYLNDLRYFLEAPTGSRWDFFNIDYKKINTEKLDDLRSKLSLNYEQLGKKIPDSSLIDWKVVDQYDWKLLGYSGSAETIINLKRDVLDSNHRLIVERFSSLQINFFKYLLLIMLSSLFLLKQELPKYYILALLMFSMFASALVYTPKIWRSIYDPVIIAYSIILAYLTVVYIMKKFKVINIYRNNKVSNSE